MNDFDNFFRLNGDLTKPAVLADDEEQASISETVPNAEYFKKYLARCYNAVLTSDKIDLNQRSNPLGNENFRKAIASFMARFHKVSVDPKNIVVGSGIESLIFNMLHLPAVIDPASTLRKGGLLSRAEHLQDVVTPIAAVGEDASPATRKLFTDANMQVKEIALDDQGVSYNSLLTSGATLLYTTPQVLPEFLLEDPAERRENILNWANEAAYRYIIEYDNNSCKKLEPLFKSLDRHDTVIYISSFSSLLCNGVSASWMVLPERVLAQYKAHFEKFPCQLSHLEQLALTLFIEKGYLDTYLESIQPSE